MKLVHLADLHLGKKVNEFSMIDDQEYILKEIINIIDDEKTDGVLVAGDVFDRPIPSEEAIKLWDDFLNAMAKRNIQVFAISGNHDSAVRFAEHTSLMDSTGIHLSPEYNGKTKKYQIEKQGVKVNIYLLPFIKPIHVRHYFHDEDINNYTDACRVAIENMQVNKEELNILIAHQFVTGATRCDSEEISVGGLDNVDVTVFEDFDYVALGHIHGKQTIGRDTIRYSGTPLKYSFSEKNHVKSVTVIEIDSKKDISVKEVNLTSRRDMAEIRGKCSDLIQGISNENVDANDYLQVVLTDENDVPNAMSDLRRVYPNIMKLSYDNTRTREDRNLELNRDVEKKSPIDLFKEFYENQNNQSLTDEQREFMEELIEEIWEGGDK
ncbi:MAG: exonuclease SbcCD subunit D [Lachnospiraceae bacterium]|nr:exonuclease SbcCD subunit D [Lachnospiraceae bacterium]